MAKKFYLVFDQVRLATLVSISAFTIILCFAQIIFRYFTFLTLRPFSWGDEVLRLSAIWVIFLGISYGIRENAHFAVDLILNKIKKPTTRHIVDVSIDVIVILILVVLTYEGFLYSITNISSTLQNADISMAWFYAAIPVGCAFGLVEYAYKIAYGGNVKKWLVPR